MRVLQAGRSPHAFRMEDLPIQQVTQPLGRCPDTRQLALAAARAADENRGRDIVVLDVRELTPVFDYFVIATGSSRRQLHAMSDDIDRVLRKEFNYERLGVEGYEGSRWILLDYGNVVVHLLDPEAREYYALEQLWCRGQRVPFEPAETAAATS